MSSRDFTVNVDGQGVNLKVISITPEIRQESQKVYAHAMLEALGNDMLLRAEANDILEERGLLNIEQQEKKADDLRKQLKEMEKQLRSARNTDGSKMTREQGKSLALKMRDLRSEISSIGQDLSDFYSNTVEHYASNEQMQYFVYACTIYQVGGKRYWPSFEDFKKDTSSPVFESAISNFVSMSAGVDQDFTKSFYENQWMIRMGYMNDKLQLIDSEGRLIDENGRLINDKGQWVNENGHLIDAYGNLIDDKGNLIMEDGWVEII